MPSVIYDHAQGTNSGIKAIQRFESFLDDSHNEIAKNLHESMVKIHSEIDDEVTQKLDEYESRVLELEERIKELQEELENKE